MMDCGRQTYIKYFKSCDIQNTNEKTPRHFCTQSLVDTLDEPIKKTVVYSLGEQCTDFKIQLNLWPNVRKITLHSAPQE